MRKRDESKATHEVSPLVVDASVTDDDPEDVVIEGMVNHVHVVLGGERARDAIYGTRKRSVGKAVGCFPDLCVCKISVELVSVCAQVLGATYHVKFGKDKINLRRVRAIIKEHDNALARIDHLAQRWPLIVFHWNVRWDVD